MYSGHGGDSAVSVNTAGVKREREEEEEGEKEIERKLGSVYEVVNILGVSQTKISGFFFSEKERSSESLPVSRYLRR